MAEIEDYATVFESSAGRATLLRPFGSSLSDSADKHSESVDSRNDAVGNQYKQQGESHLRSEHR